MSRADRRPASVQAAGIRLEAIEDRVARFADAQHCAVLELTGGDVNVGDENREELILAGLATFLNGLRFPVQLLVRAAPMDLGRYLERQEERARSGELTAALADLARDHAAFVRSLARQRTLLERHFYAVVPAASRPRRASGRLGRLPRLLSGQVAPLAEDEPTIVPGGGAGTELEPAVSRLLTFRCDEVARQLRRAGLEAQRLDDVALAQLYHASWSPERARIQRLRQQLSEYTALVVRARRTGHGR